jgi:hypothetical protein
MRRGAAFWGGSQRQLPLLDAAFDQRLGVLGTLADIDQQAALRVAMMKAQ